MERCKAPWITSEPGGGPRWLLCVLTFGAVWAGGGGPRDSPGVQARDGDPHGLIAPLWPQLWVSVPQFPCEGHAGQMASSLTGVKTDKEGVGESTALCVLLCVPLSVDRIKQVPEKTQILWTEQERFRLAGCGCRSWPLGSGGKHPSGAAGCWGVGDRRGLRTGWEACSCHGFPLQSRGQPGHQLWGGNDPELPKGCTRRGLGL